MSKHNAQILSLRQLIARMPADGNLAKNVRGLVNRISDLAELVAKLQTEPDPMASELATSLQLAAAKTRLSELVGNAKSKVAALIETERCNIAFNQAQKANLVPNEYASEIRIVFRAKDTNGQLQMLDAAIQAGDAATVAAIVLAPQSTTGLTPVIATQFKTLMLEKLAPMDDSYVTQLEETSAVILSVTEEMAA